MVLPIVLILMDKKQTKPHKQTNKKTTIKPKTNQTKTETTQQQNRKKH